MGLQQQTQGLRSREWPLQIVLPEMDGELLLVPFSLLKR